jgi:patatin-like phospholipase/acyl hydrolase
MKILSVDGGGIRGLFPARLLQHVEEATGRPAATMVDVLAGTSAGGMLVTALAARIPAKTIGDLLAQKGAVMFANPAGEVGNFLRPKYSPAPLEAELLAMLGDRWLSSLPITPYLLVTSYAIQLPAPVQIDGGAVTTTRDPVLFSSRAVRAVAPPDAGDYDFLLRDVCRATSAAPTYFPPAEIKSRSGKTLYCVDGGIGDNCPALTAFTEFRNGSTRILSLGTGTIEAPLDAKAAMEWGEARWITPLIECMMDFATDKTCRQLDRLLGMDHIRIDSPLGAVASAFDDASPGNVAAIEALAEKVWADAGDRILKMLTTN